MDGRVSADCTQLALEGGACLDVLMMRFLWRKQLPRICSDNVKCVMGIM